MVVVKMTSIIPLTTCKGDFTLWKIMEPMTNHLRL